MVKDTIKAYGELSSLFYDATEKYASQREVHFFSSFIKQYPGRVLEAMSGSGRLQIPLMQCGHVVDGVDISYAMLDRCRQRCAKLGLRPELYEQSLEHLFLPYKYRTVIVAVGSLQLIVDPIGMKKALKNLHDHMFVGGQLFIDIFVPDITIDQSSVSTVYVDEHRVLRLTKRHQFDVEKKLVHSFCLYELMVDGIVVQQENELIEVVWYSDNEWQELLFNAGFEVVQIYDEIFRKSEPSRVIHARAIC